MAPPPWPPSTCFSATRLTGSAFKIVHDDAYDENPFIYLKLLNVGDQPLALLVDTGCGADGARDRTVAMKSLREFIEAYPQPELGGAALNPQGFRKYVVVCSHCHYDHICGIEEFAPDSWTDGGTLSVVYAGGAPRTPFLCHPRSGGTMSILSW